MRVVLDTNVFVSALVRGGRPLEAVEFCLSGGCELIASEPILGELAGILSGKFGWQQREIRDAVERIRQFSDVVNPAIVVTDCSDPDDNRILEAAVAGAAECIVSGDKHLRRMKAYRGIEILNASGFLSRMGL
jgi:hypothetical protein